MYGAYVGIACAAWPPPCVKNGAMQFSCMSLIGLLSGVYSVVLTFSGVPSFGGVGGKLNDPDVVIEGGTERGAVGLGCVRDLLNWLIHPECAWGTIDLSGSHGIGV